MGASLHFADIAPPRLAEPQPGPLSGLPELMQAISNHRDAVAQAQQQLELERQRTESEVAAQGQQTAASKQQMAQKQADFDRQQKILAAHDLVAGELGNVATQPGDLSQNIEAARVKLIQQNKQLAPFINDAVNSQKVDALKTLSDAADMRTKTANANVAEGTQTGKIAGENATNAVAVATAPAKITTANADAARAQTEAETAVVQQHLAKLSETYGENRGQLASSVLAGGGTLGQAYRISGVPVPPGVDPNWTTGKGATSAMAARQKDYAALMTDALPEIEKSYNKVNAKAVTAMAKFPLAANPLADETTQKYMSNFRDWLAGVLHEESGARLNDTQLAWGIARYAHIAGDKPGTVEDKMNAMRAVTKARMRDANYRIPGAPYSDEALATFTPGISLPIGVHPVVSDMFTPATRKP